MLYRQGETDMNHRQPESADKLIDDLESLQALLDQEAGEARIPVLSDVVDPGDTAGREGLTPSVTASALELDFEGFEVDEQLLIEGLGLEEPTVAAAPAPIPARAPVPEAPAFANPPWAPPLAGMSPAAASMPAVDTPTVSEVIPPAPAAAHSPIHQGEDEVIAEMVNRCLAELETLLRPRLEQLCRELLATPTSPDAE